MIHKWILHLILLLHRFSYIVWLKCSKIDFFFEEGCKSLRRMSVFSYGGWTGIHFLFTLGQGKHMGMVYFVKDFSFNLRITSGTHSVGLPSTIYSSLWGVV